MNEREMLELAAKAAGQERSIAGDLWSNARGLLWNPLTDDGDALRLAVKLHLMVTIAEGTSYADHYHNTEPNIAEPHGDPYAATRRAITRAAAEIGRAMK